MSGVTLRVEFSPETQSAAAVAQRLCVDQAAKIGVNQENFKLCVEKVGEYLQAAVDDWISEKTFSTPVTINDKRINVGFIPEAESSAAVATKLCTENQKLLGFTDMNSCVTPLSNHLQRSVDNWYAEKTLSVPVVVEGNQFEMTFMPERQAPNDMATKLCVENARVLGVTEGTLPTCINGVTDYLNKAVSQWVQSKTLDFSLNINSKPYRFRFLPERESADAVAVRFCGARAAEFELTRENINEVCVTPITARIAEVVQQWVNSKVVSVPLRVGSQQVDIRFIPERESTVRVARRFCLTNAKELQLTEENFASTCLEPVNNLLLAGVEKAAAAGGKTA